MKGALVDSLDTKGSTPLLALCKSQVICSDVVIMLVQNGANVRVKDQEGYSLFHHICKSRNAN